MDIGRELLFDYSNVDFSRAPFSKLNFSKALSFLQKRYFSVIMRFVDSFLPQILEGILEGETVFAVFCSNGDPFLFTWAVEAKMRRYRLVKINPHCYNDFDLHTNAAE